MKMLAEYLEHAIKFEQLAAQERDAQLRTALENRPSPIEPWPKSAPKNLASDCAAITTDNFRIAPSNVAMTKVGRCHRVPRGNVVIRRGHCSGSRV